MPASYETHRAQLETLLTAWGMPPGFAQRTAEVMSWADLHGIDSHGISMIPAYFDRQKNGRVNMRAQPRRRPSDGEHGLQIALDRFQTQQQCGRRHCRHIRRARPCDIQGHRGRW